LYAGMVSAVGPGRSVSLRKGSPSLAGPEAQAVGKSLSAGTFEPVGANLPSQKIGANDSVSRKLPAISDEAWSEYGLGGIGSPPVLGSSERPSEPACEGHRPHLHEVTSAPSHSHRYYDKGECPGA